MRVTLVSAGLRIGYELFPASKRLARRHERNTGHESVLFQTDWDFPGLAQSLGWNIRTAHKRGCACIGETDGTISCPGCGRTASHFISAANDWLDKRVDTTMQPRGIDCYFDLIK